MGNCFKKGSIINKSYLFEPLNSEDENIFCTNNYNIKSNSMMYSEECKNKIIFLETEIENLNEKLKLLEKNTQDNLKLLSDDIHYINNKTKGSIENT
jgi:hypothetical protein